MTHSASGMSTIGDIKAFAVFVLALQTSCGGLTSSAANSTAEMPACGPDAGGPISSRSVALVAAPGNTVNGIVSDGTNLYWTACGPSEASVGKVSVNGGATTKLFSLSGAHANQACTWGSATGGIAVDGTSVYWLKGASEIAKVPLAGGAISTVATWGSEAQGTLAPRSFALDSDSIYFGYAILSGNVAVVAKVPLQGGTVSTLATWASPAPSTDGPQGIALGGATMYWTRTEYHPWPVVSLAPGGTPMTVVSGNLSTPFIAADATGVYYSDEGGIKKIPVGGVRPVTLAPMRSAAGNIVVDEKSVYWESWVLGKDSSLGPSVAAAIMSVPLGGGTPTTLVKLCSDEGNSASPLAVDKTSLYWAAENGDIMKVTPK